MTPRQHTFLSHNCSLTFQLNSYLLAALAPSLGLDSAPEDLPTLYGKDTERIHASYWACRHVCIIMEQKSLQ